MPAEDQGYLLGAVIMPDAASLDRTARREPPRRPISSSKNPATQSVVVFDGYSLLDGQVQEQRGAVLRRPQAVRGAHEDASMQTRSAVIREASAAFVEIREGIIMPINPPSIPGLGTTGGLEVYIQSQGRRHARADRRR